jgi:hypothetical protein
VVLRDVHARGKQKRGSLEIELLGQSTRLKDRDEKQTCRF